ncbi:ROK family protein [Microbacterium sp. STN6]|uniref:ROK family protein n=1 Tax=Microbacterium sp. STN6 TaxID=2995588 RepID=UPI00226096FF|nr:ROK family protein [Microbacterium sp. STN6]MCX7521228.1 ROK family protein [Microbacterium sp. STN6]
MNKVVALAVDFGGTKVEAALVDSDGALIAASRSRQPTGRAATSEQLETSVGAVVRQALAALGRDHSLIGAGVGCAGPIERARGLVSPLNVPAWRGYPLRDFVASVVHEAAPGVPVSLEMDGVAITLAEHWVGAGQGIDNLMGMVISTGIGAGLIVGGRVVTGPTGNAGHIGHVEVAGVTGEDTFGSVSSLEAVASGPHTVAWARAQGFTGATGEDLAAAYAAGDEIARRAIVRTGTAVGQAIASATALLDLELVAIGGGFSQSTPDLFDVIRQSVAQHHFAFVRKVRIVPSGLSGAGPLVGAGALVHRAELVP